MVGRSWPATSASSRKGECTKRLTQTLKTLLRMEHHEPSGMYYNWYDEATGEKLTSWPGRRRPGRPVPAPASTTAGSARRSRWCRTADRGAAPLASRLFERMRWDMFYDTNAARKPGLIHGGFFAGSRPTTTDGFYRATTSASARRLAHPTTTTTRRSPRPASRATSAS